MTENPAEEAIREFPFWDYGMDEVDPNSEYAEWVPALAAEIEAAVRARTADELRAAAQAIEDTRGENNDALAAAIYDDCERDPIAPAMRDDCRNIAIIAYRHLAARLTGTCTTPCDADCAEPCHEVHQVDFKRAHDPDDCPSARIARGEA